MDDMHARRLLEDLRSLGKVRSPAGLLDAVLSELNLGDQYAPLDSPLGRLFVAWNDVGVSAVMRSSTAEDFEAQFQARFGRAVRAAETVPADVQDRFDLRSVTEFERAVLLKAREIPAGEVRTYGWVAAAIGAPRAVRAVGTALRKNPVPVLIPCHRVVRSDGKLGEYALGGPEAKRAILASEGVRAENIDALARRYRAAV
jgi:O-6-methylguanine DNA methyltransferase